MKIEHALYHLLKPVGDAAYYFFNNPLNALSSGLYATGDFIQDNPYTCIAIIGLGAYAAHKGALKYNNGRVNLTLDIDTCVGGYQTNTSLWVGKRR
jgi:type II secretory pathway component PulF